MTRIPFVNPDELSDEARGFLGSSPATGIVSVMANASDSFAPWFRAVNAIRASPDLNPVLRELVILRTAGRLGCDYELFHHRRVALEAGVPVEQIDAACSGAPLPGEHGKIVALIDDLYEGRAPGDERYREALELISQRALVEAIMIAGVYTTIGRLIEAAALTP